MDVVLSLTLILGITLHPALSQLSPPKVSITFPDVGDRDWVNGSMAIITNSNPDFVLQCNATYPIEWVFHYDERDDGTSEQIKLAVTRRHAVSFLKEESYHYFAKVRIAYKGKLLILVNYTCKGTESDDPNHKTHVVMNDNDNNRNTLRMEISNGNREQITNPERGGVKTWNETCERAVTAVSYLLKKRNPCWTCQVPNGGMELELDFEPCYTPIQCNSMHKRQNKGKQCLNVVEVEEYPNNCKINGRPAFHPKMVLCKNYGPALAQLYFFGVFNNRSALGPPIYFDWEDVDPTEMLYMHPIKSHVYQGEEIEIKCEYSRYYFSLGSWFAFGSGNRAMEYVRGFDIKPCETEGEKVEAIGKRNCNDTALFRRLGTYTATLKRNFTRVGPQQVFCFGPVWNSTQWVHTSLSFVVERGETPQAFSVGPESTQAFVLGQRNRSLTCDFKGIPKPTVTWKGPKGSAYTIDESGFQSRLVISEIGYQSSGIYTCTASSFLGNHSKTFQFESRPPSEELSTGAITGIVLACLGIASVVLLVILRMRAVILRQRRELRLLTESEIQEFIRGNPDLVKKAETDFFNNALAIDALPFDQQFEIQVDKLDVDRSHILGSGEFGVVMKGKVVPENTSHYVNSALMNGQGMIRALDVAVKISKKDVSVEHFKTLLAEVKVMAYLGKHANIISLIGASTKNIRNRELYVVVEYCENGSLTSYLREHKGRFVNKVKYGIIKEEDQPSSFHKEVVGQHPPSISNAYVNLELETSSSSQPFSTRELLKWTEEIANGMEYIHSKRVIHGDLAIRNVLLTKELTAKVGDFGLSRQLGEMSSYTKRSICPLPWRNMAVESLKHMEFSVHSDMWSFGVTLWELFTLGAIPYPGMGYSLDFIRELEEGSLRLGKPSNATNDIYDFMLMCWEQTPRDRPTTSEIQIVCRKLLEKIGH